MAAPQVKRIRNLGEFLLANVTAATTLFSPERRCGELGQQEGGQEQEKAVMATGLTRLVNNAVIKFTSFRFIFLINTEAPELR